MLCPRGREGGGRERETKRDRERERQRERDKERNGEKERGRETEMERERGTLLREARSQETDQWHRLNDTSMSVAMDE